MDLFRKRRIRASEYQFTYPLLKHMASVYTPQLSDSIDMPCLSCKTILIAKLPLQHIGESRRLKRLSTTSGFKFYIDQKKFLVMLKEVKGCITLMEIII